MFHAKPVEKIKTHILCSISFFIFFFSKVVYEILWKNIVEPGRPQMTIFRMRIACWIPKAINTHSKYVIHIIYCFYSAVMVERTRYSVTLYVICLSC